MERNIVSLKPSFRTIDEDFEETKKVIRKEKALEKWMKRNFPENVIGNYYFDSIGFTCIRCIIHLNPEDNKSVLNLIKWMKSLRGKRIGIEKFWRPENGYFSYKIKREYGGISGNSFILLIENGANIDGCKIIKKRKMKTIYTTDCEQERILI